MVSKTVTIEAPNGMHARPVSALVALRTPAKSVSGASMIGILSLGLKKGSEVEVAVEGDNEQAVLDEVVAAIEAITD